MGIHNVCSIHLSFQILNLLRLGQTRMFLFQIQISCFWTQLALHAVIILARDDDSDAKLKRATTSPCGSSNVIFIFLGRPGYVYLTHVFDGFNNNAFYL